MPDKYKVAAIEFLLYIVLALLIAIPFAVFLNENAFTSVIAGMALIRAITK